MSPLVPLSRRPGVATLLGNHEGRLRGLERQPPGRWVYVGEAPSGTNPGDPDCTPDSPPFENGVENAGGGAQRLRFRRTNEWNIEVEGVVTTPVIGTEGEVVVTTLPSFWRPNETQYAIGVNSEQQPVIWRLDVSGELVYLGTAVSEITQGDLDEVGGLHWGENTDADSEGLELDSTSSLDMAFFSALLATTFGLTLRSVNAGIDLDTSPSGGSITLDSGSSIFLTADAGGNVVLQAGGETRFEVEDATGATMDIQPAGRAFVINDAAGNPLVTYTG